jgi:uncharacterized protein with FMN-binding domain
MELLTRVGVGIGLVLGFLLPADVALAETLTATIQTGRMTVIEIDKPARRIVCMNSQGQVFVHKVTNEAIVVTDGWRTADLAGLTAGDIIKAELRDGRIQKIVVLRHAWHETASPEQ